MDIRKILGKNVKQYREHKKLSQEALAEISGLHRTYISGIERGARNPTILIVSKIAVALGISFSDLLKK